MGKKSLPSHKEDRKKFETNNKTNALNILYISHSSEEIKHAYISKYNSTHENQVILLLITYDEKWYYIAAKSLSALLRGINSKNNGDFYCLNCHFVHLFRTENRHKIHENVCKNYDYCYLGMPEKSKNISKYNHGQKSMKTSFIIYGDMES